MNPCPRFHFPGQKDHPTSQLLFFLFPVSFYLLLSQPGNSMVQSSQLNVDSILQSQVDGLIARINLPQHQGFKGTSPENLTGELECSVSHQKHLSWTCRNGIMEIEKSSEHLGHPTGCVSSKQKQRQQLGEVAQLEEHCFVQV